MIRAFPISVPGIGNDMEALTIGPQLYPDPADRGKAFIITKMIPDQASGDRKFGIHRNGPQASRFVHRPYSPILQSITRWTFF